MGPIYWDLDPEIITLFGTFPLKYYGLFFVTGIILSYKLAQHIYKLEKVPVDDLDKLATFLFVGILVGMRLGHCLFYDFEYFSKHPLEIFLPFQITDGNWTFTGFAGLASHGGSIGAIIAIIWYARKYKTSIVWILDRIAIVTPITGAFIRLGNFMNSEIYGKPTNGDYGVVFVRDDMIPRHPTQIYEAFAYLVIFGLLWYLYKKTNITSKRGALFGLLLSILFTARFIIEFFKENQVAFEDSMSLNMGQWLSVPFVVAGIALLFLHKTNKKVKITS
ncbi:prolipoprotein diacylglyceryl transferase [Aquimarina algicola]|uniref:Phosphatidylglycerol--prolipoprotein diacylglyceryl transferase n=1 Tax=Aquimarina algicola TaxID=2589995 RepID=A0A504JGJ6_9FLAO|nr:prolipoprotein diacylglyceryl transferase [Aquimarina algicola]TPN87545.1 prolipoprotein diacylglyceryl transferase [Aquimarina algicola]